MTTYVRTGSRLHCSLLDLGRVTERAYGGSGFMIAGPVTKVSATRSPAWRVESTLQLDQRTQDELQKGLEGIARYTKGLSAILSVESLPPQHVGLGTKTALLLASLTAVQHELGIQLDREALQLLSGRGGASGIGIHGFFTGGFVVDEGHPQEEVSELIPSSARRPKKPPLLRLQLPIPEAWRFHLVLPKGTIREGLGEVEFFSRNVPIPKEEVDEAISATYEGLVPAVRAGDIQNLRGALARLHKSGFKARELEGHGEATLKAYHVLGRVDTAAIGLSSIGPLLYAILDANDTVGAEAIVKTSIETNSIYLGSFSGLSQGYNT